MPDLRRLSLKVDLLMESQVIIQLVRWDLLALIPRKAVLRQSVQQERFLSLEVCICTIITIKLLCHVKAYFSIQLPCYWTKCFQDCVSWPSLLFVVCMSYVHVQQVHEHRKMFSLLWDCEIICLWAIFATNGNLSKKMVQKGDIMQSNNANG